MICELPFLGISVLPFELQQSVDTRDDGKEKHQSCVTSAYHYRLFCSNEIKAFCYVGRVWDLEWWFCARVRVCVFFSFNSYEMHDKFGFIEQGKETSRR